MKPYTIDGKAYRVADGRGWRVLPTRNAAGTAATRIRSKHSSPHPRSTSKRDTATPGLMLGSRASLDSLAGIYFGHIKRARAVCNCCGNEGPGKASLNERGQKRLSYLRAKKARRTQWSQA